MPLLASAVPRKAPRPPRSGQRLQPPRRCPRRRGRTTHTHLSAAYGIFAIVPGVIAMAGQSVELVRAPHVKGVSTASLLLGTLNQTLWAIWAVMLQDSGSMIAILATSCSWCSTSSGTSFGDSACARSSHRHSRCCPRWPQPVAAHRQPKRSSRQPTTERGPSSKGRAPL